MLTIITLLLTCFLSLWHECYLRSWMEFLIKGTTIKNHKTPWLTNSVFENYLTVLKTTCPDDLSMARARSSSTTTSSFWLQPEGSKKLPSKPQPTSCYAFNPAHVGWGPWAVIIVLARKRKLPPNTPASMTHQSHIALGSQVTWPSLLCAFCIQRPCNTNATNTISWYYPKDANTNNLKINFCDFIAICIILLCWWK